MERDKKEIKSRSRFIRRRTPEVLADCYEMQNHICDLCGREIQCLDVASLDHSVPISYFSKGDLDIVEASRCCNDRSNLRATHFRCNIVKNGRPRAVWFAKGMDSFVGEARILTDDEIKTLKLQMSERGRYGNTFTPRAARILGSLNQSREDKAKGGRIAGPINGKNGNREGKRKCGLAAKDKKTGIWADGFDRTRGPRIGGHNTSLIPGHMSEAGRLGSHIAQHVNKNRKGLNCKFCSEQPLL